MTLWADASSFRFTLRFIAPQMWYIRALVATVIILLCNLLRPAFKHFNIVSLMSVPRVLCFTNAWCPRHTSLAKGHIRNRCAVLSSPWLHSGHIVLIFENLAILVLTLILSCTTIQEVIACFGKLSLCHTNFFQGTGLLLHLIWLYALKLLKGVLHW